MRHAITVSNMGSRHSVVEQILNAGRLVFVTAVIAKVEVFIDLHVVMRSTNCPVLSGPVTTSDIRLKFIASR